MIVRDAGAAIPAIVDERGWHHFRDLEFEACETAARLAADATHHEDWTLIDAGGGVIVDLDAAGNEIFSKRKIDALRGGRAREADAARRRRRNVIVYIKRDVSYLLNRTSGDANRPSLSETHSFATVMRRREPWYFDAADYVVDATGGAVESAVKKKREIKEEVLEYFYAETGEEAGTEEEEVVALVVVAEAGGEGQQVAAEGGEPRERSLRRRRSRPRSRPRRLNPTPTLALTVTQPPEPEPEP